MGVHFILVKAGPTSISRATRLARATNIAAQNLRLNPNDGTLIATDGMLAFAAGDPNAGANPTVTGSAYADNFAGAMSTKLYRIDLSLDILVTQLQSNIGALNTVGVNANNLLGFDMSGKSGPRPCVVQWDRSQLTALRNQFGERPGDPVAAALVWFTVSARRLQSFRSLAPCSWSASVDWPFSIGVAACATTSVRPIETRTSAFPVMRHWLCHCRTRSPLRRCASHVFGTRAFGALADVELNTVTLTKVVEALAVHSTLVEEILLPRSVFDKPESLVHAQRANRSCHPVLHCD